MKSSDDGVSTVSELESVSASAPSFDLEEVSITGLQRLMTAGDITARSVTEQYLARIEMLDRRGPALHSVIQTNPDAVEIAQRLDEERERTGPRSPLHGVPILLKDNIATGEAMPTTAGSLALVGSTYPEDAHIGRLLRQAGAVLLGKANMSEWANFRSSRSISGWSAMGGQCRNPYALDRSPSGSSSGPAAATAANLCAGAIGTETDGSIISPAHSCGVVGVKPTVGLVSRTGIIPIAHSQDTAGPLARTVQDAALLLSAIAGTDGSDRATTRSPFGGGLAIRFREDGLSGKSLGVVRSGVFGLHRGVDAAFERALETLRELGARLIDPVSVAVPSQYRQNQVLLSEFKADLEAYLVRTGPETSVRTLEDVIAFNEERADDEMRYFGQDVFLQALEAAPRLSREYRRARASNRAIATDMDRAISSAAVDALVAPTSTPVWLIDPINGDCAPSGSWSSSAVAGYPHITVPAGYVGGLPVGISFFGPAWSERRLLAIAYAFERVTQYRRPPRFALSAEDTGTAI